MSEVETFNTPILVIFFNRPDTLRQVLEKIKEAKAPILYLAQDGPRHGNSLDEKLCRECKVVVQEIVDWNPEVKTLYRDSNLGCKLGVSGAIDWFFKNVEEGIILEDDCVPDLSFFNYTQFMLKYYRENLSIGMICGSNLINHFKEPVEKDIYFSRMPLVWGWASWSRAWKMYDVEIKKWPKSKEVLNFLEDDLFLKNWVSIFDRVFLGKVDTWDYQFNFMLWSQRLLCVIPKNNLIINVGFDDRATHTLSKPEYLNDQIVKIKKDCEAWVLPEIIEVDIERDHIFLQNQLDPNINFFKSSILGLCVNLKHFISKFKRRAL